MRLQLMKYGAVIAQNLLKLVASTVVTIFIIAQTVR